MNIASVPAAVKRGYGQFCACESLVAGTFLVLMVALIFLGGVMRMFGHPINWSTDAATGLFAWACFLCADIAWRKNSMMSIEVVTVRLPAKWQAGCRMLNYFLISCFLGYLVVMGVWLSWISRVRTFQGIPEISYSWVTLSLPAGAALMLISTAIKVAAEMRGEHIANGSAMDVL